MRVTLCGAVQGVGFRPFVYRLASRLGLAGTVGNTPEGLRIEVEGPEQDVGAFLAALPREAPPLARIRSLVSAPVEPRGERGFRIDASDPAGAPSAWVLPDIATCADCLRELFDADDRRFRYPFLNCTHCGPRFSIVLDLPYDRECTSMRGFRMCEACACEYEQPADRRFHAQPNACPACGPRLELWSEDGAVLAQENEALLRAAEAVRSGRVVALKGLGGFHLLVDAGSEEAVLRLRLRKRRETKPFAVMVPDVEAARRLCALSEVEEALLRSPEAPIVLSRRRPEASGIAPAVAPGNPYLGLLLPYTPLHHLMAVDLGRPFVATSGNRSDEPICTDEREALLRLRGIADLFLIHDRPIARPVDDSVARVIAGEPLLLRRARGYAPLPVTVAETGQPVLALGAHQKSTVALAAGGQVYVSQHLGDLETVPAREAFRRAAADLPRLYRARPAAVACDLHPDYFSTHVAEAAGSPVLRVQHHHAHVLACIAEHEIEGAVLGVAWDGTGCGPDGTVWGGEFLRVEGTTFERVAHLRRFRLPGGEAAAREPRRSALGLLHALLGDAAFSHPAVERLFTREELALLSTTLRRAVSAPVTSSAGRLFDGAAALLGLGARSSYEGETASRLEFAVASAESGECLDLPVRRSDETGAWEVDWEPLVRRLLEDRCCQSPLECSAALFHESLAGAIVQVAERVSEEQVVLTGGCFQNRLLAEWTVRRLEEAGFRPFRHREVPPNDGGIALGQAVAALRILGAAGESSDVPGGTG